jgi:uncharacterized membrane protein YebE (DUF533 family)
MLLQNGTASTGNATARSQMATFKQHHKGTEAALLLNSKSSRHAKRKLLQSITSESATKIKNKHHSKLTDGIFLPGDNAHPM